MGKVKLIPTGAVFGDRTVLACLGLGTHRRIQYSTRCSCGKITVVSGSALRNGRSNSCGKAHTRKPYLGPGESALRALWRRYRNGAKARKLEWTLSRKQFDILIAGDCFYCGAPPRFQQTATGLKNTVLANGIDRKNNKEGYKLKNCVSACYLCNRIKMDSSAEEFLSHVERIYKRRIKSAS